ncbi:TMEM175 family protein [Flavitalea sp. BT771]|uniref:TMEM175 family protein n=1 Tax=Flavitalea sp. BT771 TaxID=3063329 RepID=UPI0026E38A37|nr:TMEM175 family protein [Flavitalea sp. BT771]MDO6434529.1 TMEM175 family protein [Flavitalea sp. BT771]MDV6223429.1 TMEM175 family protein [Flavitalea sp. BT771]
MKKTRFEAFSDGVLAIIITIMVLEIKVPHGERFSDLKELYPIFLSYALSFIYIGIYWNNHHHMMSAVSMVTGGILWANLHLLFWLSLVPFATGWIGENHFAAAPMTLYGFVLLMAGVAYYILQSRIIKNEGKNSLLAKAIGKDLKGKISPFLYITAMALAWLNSIISGVIYLAAALIWLIPDKRIERALRQNKEGGDI